MTWEYQRNYDLWMEFRNVDTSKWTSLTHVSLWRWNYDSRYLLCTYFFFGTYFKEEYQNCCNCFPFYPLKCPIAQQAGHVGIAFHAFLHCGFLFFGWRAPTVSLWMRWEEGALPAVITASALHPFFHYPLPQDWDPVEKWSGDQVS